MTMARNDKRTILIKNTWSKALGTDGWIEVSRGRITASDESLLPIKDEKLDPALTNQARHIFKTLLMQSKN